MDFSKIRNIIFLISLIVVSLFFVYIIKPIFYPVFWAAIIAGIFHPLYEKLQRKIKSENLSATLVLVIVMLIILIPLTLISSLLIKESIDLYGALGSRGGQINSTVGQVINWVKQSSFFGRSGIDENFWISKISEISSAITTFIFQTVKSLTENSVTFLVMFVVMLYALFFFLRDGETILKKIMYLLPLGDKHELMFYRKFTSTARAAIKGTLVIGLAQGAIGTLLFYFVGIQGALIWGLIMMAFSILIGCYLVWVPAGIIMLILGNTWQGIMILAVGILIISTIDNVLRPALVGRETKMHPLLIFLSTLGGVFVFGLSGFIIGPVIVALLQSFWEMYEHYYHRELSNN